MKAVVLAGGQEFGQCPLARQLPRALWPLIDKPLIQHVLAALRSAGIAGSMISANGQTQDIARQLGQHPAEGITVHYSEDTLPRGAAGCIKDCQGWLGDETFLVAHGASLMMGLDLAHLLEEHRSSGAAMTVAVDGVALNSTRALRPAGLYVCEPTVFGHISGRGYQDIKEQLIPRLLGRGLLVRAVPVRGRIYSIRNEECYLNATIEVLDQSGGPRIDATATIHRQARVVGPVHIGPEAVVMRDTLVIGPAVLGPGCVVEERAVVHESILWAGSRIGRGAVVEQAVAAAGATVRRGLEVRRSIVMSIDAAVVRANVAADAAPGVTPRWYRRVLGSLRPASNRLAAAAPTLYQ